MTVRVKICGLRDAAGWDAAVAAGADWLGLVFFPPSPRFVTVAEAAALARRDSGGAGLVGLFVVPFAKEAMWRILEAVPLAAVQIYGPTDGLREQLGVPVWRAVGVSGVCDLPCEAAGVERLVIEAKAPAGATRPGGNAARFDWEVLAGWKAPVPWTLAGGLSVANVAEAVRRTGAAAVDVSSGVESAPGRKDPELIRAFIEAARGAGPGR